MSLVFIGFYNNGSGSTFLKHKSYTLPSIVGRQAAQITTSEKTACPYTSMTATGTMKTARVSADTSASEEVTHRKKQQASNAKVADVFDNRGMLPVFFFQV